MEPDELCDRLGEGWVSEEALALAVACCVAHDEPLEALLASVNHHGDSDSTGSIAGNLLGLSSGAGWLSDTWVDQVEGTDLVRTVAGDLWTERHDPPDIDDGQSTWFDRYPGW
jgi:ADP-ribosylglycohydrolase